MKSILVILLFIASISQVNGQADPIDSLKKIISMPGSDSARTWNLGQLSNIYRWKNPDSSLFYAEEGLRLAKAIGYKDGELYCLANLSGAWWGLGDYETSIRLLLPHMDEINRSKEIDVKVTGMVSIMNSYRELGDYKEALRYNKRLDSMRVKGTGIPGRINAANMAQLYLKSKNNDSAKILINSAFTYPKETGMTGWPYSVAGEIYKSIGNYDSAFYFYRLALPVLEEEKNTKDLAGAYIHLADLFNVLGNRDSAKAYAFSALRTSKEKRFAKEYLEALNQLASSYLNTNSDSALHYLVLANNVRDSLFSIEKQIKLSSFRTSESLRQQDIENTKSEYRSQVEKYILSALVAISLLIGIILWRNNRHKQKSNERLQFQKQQTEKALEELKATQAQLIQSEKMASLGELTAGIAHEIQNPLNFVNNFSEINKDLLDEVKRQKSIVKTEELGDLLEDILQNNEKILHHGKRADAIVKGMLQHSRSGSGAKEPTNINALADEYLRLAYHGHRAKDKFFNANIKTEFDERIGKIDIIPQDIGRVLLNLINNAFYAVDEKKKQIGDGYEPEVTVSTRLTNESKNSLIISVRDNGNGIPEKIRNKIFQPFFTTKPTGEGTGLGLSLSYDIIKAHGGEIRAESREGEGSVFTIVI